MIQYPDYLHTLTKYNVSTNSVMTYFLGKIIVISMVLTIMLTNVLRALDLRTKTKLKGIQGEIGKQNFVETKILKKFIKKHSYKL